MEDLEKGYVPDGSVSWAGSAGPFTVEDSSLRSKFGGQTQDARASGCFLPAQLSGVLGPANSGKTAFLRALAQHQKPGATGFDVGASTVFFDAYETLVFNLTVEGQLRYAADLSSSWKTPAADKAARINEVIQLLGLEVVRHCRIGCAWAPGISAEDMRRTSIGVALVCGVPAAPSVLLLDSPMAGLPAAAGNRVMRTLKLLAQRGLTVVAALDAPTPTAYALLDRVLVLQQGRTLYLGGPGSQLVAHFQTLGLPSFDATPLPESEWLVEGLEQPDPHTDGPVSTCAKFFPAAAAATAAAAEAAPLTSLKEAASRTNRRNAMNPAWFSFWTLFWRRTLANVRDPVWWVMRVLDKAFFCVLIMSLFWHRGSLLDPASASNIISLLWMLALLPLFYTAFYLGLLVYEMPVFLRERNAGWYGSGVYLAHKMFEEIALAAIQTLPLSCILFFPIQLHGSWLFFWLTYVTISTVAIVFGYLLAAVVPTTEAATGLMPIIVISALFFGGCLLRDADIPAWWHWLSYANPLRYSYGAFMVNEYGGRLGWDAVLVPYNLQSTDKWNYLGYLSVFVAGLGLLLWLALALKRTAPQYRLNISLRQY